MRTFPQTCPTTNAKLKCGHCFARNTTREITHPPYSRRASRVRRILDTNDVAWKHEAYRALPSKQLQIHQLPQSQPRARRKVYNSMGVDQPGPQDDQEQAPISNRGRSAWYWVCLGKLCKSVKHNQRYNRDIINVRTSRILRIFTFTSCFLHSRLKIASYELYEFYEFQESRILRILISEIR